MAGEPSTAGFFKRKGQAVDVSGQSRLAWFEGKPKGNHLFCLGSPNDAYMTVRKGDSQPELGATAFVVLGGPPILTQS